MAENLFLDSFPHYVVQAHSCGISVILAFLSRSSKSPQLRCCLLEWLSKV